jgi:hypothetical protein
MSQKSAVLVCFATEDWNHANCLTNQWLAKEDYSSDISPTYKRFKAPLMTSQVSLRTALFLDVTQRRMVVCWRRFDTTFRYRLSKYSWTSLPLNMGQISWPSTLVTNCVTSRKSADLIYIAGEAWNRAQLNVLHILCYFIFILCYFIFILCYFIFILCYFIFILCYFIFILCYFIFILCYFVFMLLYLYFMLLYLYFMLLYLYFMLLYLYFMLLYLYFVTLFLFPGLPTGV